MCLYLYISIYMTIASRKECIFWELTPLPPDHLQVLTGTKRFFLDARNNARGGFVRLSEVEDVRGQKTRNAVVIPSSALPALYEQLGKVVRGLHIQSMSLSLQRCASLVPSRCRSLWY